MPEQLEERISESASLIYYLIRWGDRVQLKIHEYESPFGNSPTYLKKLIKCLALME